MTSFTARQHSYRPHVVLTAANIDILSVVFVDCVKTNKRIFNVFSPSGNQASLVFLYQTAWQYSDGNPLTWASNTCGVRRNRDSDPRCGFIACCEAFQRQMQYT